MQKIVVNKCFGGFGLSPQAEDLYAKKSGFKLYRYHYPNYTGKVLKRVDDPENHVLCYTFKKDYGETVEWSSNQDETYWYSQELKRDDPILVEVVEELGEEANGNFAFLTVTQIPDGVDWQIGEYDGQEWVEEAHRKW